MNESRKLINWVAGVSTLIVALLIIIVVNEPQRDQVSRASAARAVALTVAAKSEILASAPKTSWFPEELQSEWYVKYMDYLYEKGLLDPETCPPTEESALSGVTRGDLSDMLTGQGLAEEAPASLSEYILEKGAKKAQRRIGKSEFWEFYDMFREAADPRGVVHELVTDVYGTPNNVAEAAPWTAYTRDGKFLFEGLYLDACIDKNVRLLVRDSDILKVEEIISSEIVYENAWISGVSEAGVTVFIGNIKREFPVKGVLQDEEEISGQIGDLYLKNGTPNRLVLKKERITGTVLAVRDEEIEIEGYGNVPLSPNFKIYRTYGVLKEQQKKDILVGYHMQQFVVAGGEICAALTTERPEIDTIRVLLMSDQYQSLFHEEITLSCDSMAVLEYGGEKEKQSRSVAAGEKVTIAADDERLAGGRMIFRSANEGGMITVESISRGQGTPVYPGHMEITRETAGLLLLNEVDLEEYLKRVVPSEMPQSYELEALKAQAICARTYAWKKIQDNTYSKFGAHVDDSTNYQVYNNMETYESTDRAVNETFGQLLAWGDTVIEAFYYSTSCGYGTDGSVWGSDSSSIPYLKAVPISEAGTPADLTNNEAFAAFIKNMDAEAYESEFAMFRWQVTTTSQILDEKIDGVGRITGLAVTERGPGGVARKLKVVGTEGEKTFQGQSRIRNVLGNERLTLTRKNGSTAQGFDSLPSGFIYIENAGTDENHVTSFVIYGGGSGHGAGMSQNGAQAMAKKGKGCKEILQFFYDSCEVVDIGDVE
ncbi:MAG: SpoIID/LytB domain-containing protein [Lachnospiraceae bacterium]|nr:SpoIID/LytB domain-containing protein [Lachnospiraceae bacterium]